MVKPVKVLVDKGLVFDIDIGKRRVLGDEINKHQDVLANFMQDNTSESLETSSNLIASNRVWLSLVSSALHLQQQHPVLK